jgi:hypothetical protein
VVVQSADGASNLRLRAPHQDGLAAVAFCKPHKAEIRAETGRLAMRAKESRF